MTVSERVMCYRVVTYYILCDRVFLHLILRGVLTFNAKNTQLISALVHAKRLCFELSVICATVNLVLWPRSVPGDRSRLSVCLSALCIFSVYSLSQSLRGCCMRKPSRICTAAYLV